MNFFLLRVNIIVKYYSFPNLYFCRKSAAEILHLYDDSYRKLQNVFSNVNNFITGGGVLATI